MVVELGVALDAEFVVTVVGLPEAKEGVIVAGPDPEVVGPDPEVV